MRVLVTGGEGFTGKPIISYLQNKGFDVFATSKSYINDRLLPCDVLQIDSIVEILKKVNPNYVLHLASVSLPSFNNIEKMFDINIFGAKNLLDALLLTKCDIKKVVIASSAYVYGSAVTSTPLNEDRCAMPNSHYGNSKLSMENLVRLYFDKLPIIITRPFNYTAPGHSTDYIIPKLVENFQKKNTHISLGNIKLVRDFSDLEDIMFYYYKLLISSVDSAIINLCSGKGYSISQLIEILNNISGYKIQVIKDLSLMRKNDYPIFIGDNSRLKSIVGDYVQKSMEYTLERMLMFH